MKDSSTLCHAEILSIVVYLEVAKIEIQSFEKKSDGSQSQCVSGPAKNQMTATPGTKLSAEMAAVQIPSTNVRQSRPNFSKVTGRDIR